MRIKSVEIKNYKAFLGTYKINVAGKNLFIYGENGSGKSSLYYAIKDFFQSSMEFINLDAVENIFVKTADHGKCSIEVKFYPDPTDRRKVKPFLFSGTQNDGKDGTDTSIKDANKLKSFLTYKHLLGIHHVQRGEQVDLFDLLVKGVLTHFKFSLTHGRELGTLWQEVEGAKEDKAGRSGFLRHLKGRGLAGVKLIVSDACLAALYRTFYRNVFSVVPKAKVKEVTIMLKAINASEDREAVLEKARSVMSKLRAMKLHQAAEKIQESISETLTYYDFPSAHWRRIRTNNPLERIMREIRRRTNVVGAFPDGNSALMLVAARLRHIAGTKWSTKRYLNMDLLRELEVEREAA